MDIIDLKTMIGQRIFELRKEHKFSKKDVREKTGISEQMQKQYEEGTTKKIPSTEILLHLAELYKVPISYFFSDTFDKTPTVSNTKINSIYDVAKIIINLLQSNAISLYIKKNVETAHIRIEDMNTYEEAYTVFSFIMTDVPFAYEELESGLIVEPHYLNQYNRSILNQFLDKLLTYNELYHNKKIDTDDYNTLCEKALNIVNIEEEKRKRLIEEAFADLDKENDLPF